MCAYTLRIKFRIHPTNGYLDKKYTLKGLFVSAVIESYFIEIEIE